MNHPSTHVIDLAVGVDGYLGVITAAGGGTA